jgi:hypothetical protein
MAKMKTLKILFVLMVIIFIGCSTNKVWPDRNIETDEEPQFVEYGGPIKSFCTGSYDSGLYVTIVDSISGEPIICNCPGFISVKEYEQKNSFDLNGNYFFPVAPRDSIFIRVIGYQRRKIVIAEDCVDSVVVPLAQRKFIIWE